MPSSGIFRRIRSYGADSSGGLRPEARNCCAGGHTIVRAVINLFRRVTSDSRLEWLVVSAILILLALALALGWVRLPL